MHEQVKKTRGRPKKAAEEVRTVVVHTNLTVAEKWEMQEIAEKLEMSVSDFIRFMFHKYKQENAL